MKTFRTGVVSPVLFFGAWFCNELHLLSYLLVEMFQIGNGNCVV